LQDKSGSLKFRHTGEKFMKMTRKVLSTLAVLAVASVMTVPASATSASGTLAVSATTASSVSIIFVTNGSGIALTGSGTDTAGMAFGSVSAYGGSVPAGVTKTVNGTTDWKLSTPFDVVVQVSNQTSTNYTLDAFLSAADAVNTWDLSGTPVTSVSAPLTATGAYGSTTYTLNLTIPFSATAGVINNTINLMATAN
jgi:hypothetical protein